MTATLKKILRKIENIEWMLISSLQINEDEACKLLGITKITIQTYISKGIIPKSAYTTGIGGKRFFYPDMLKNRMNH